MLLTASPYKSGYVVRHLFGGREHAALVDVAKLSKEEQELAKKAKAGAATTKLGWSVSAAVAGAGAAGLLAGWLARSRRFLWRRA
jgi:hypothetical protein